MRKEREGPGRCGDGRGAGAIWESAIFGWALLMALAAMAFLMKAGMQDE